MSTDQTESQFEQLLLKKFHRLIGQLPIQVAFSRDGILHSNDTNKESIVIRDRRALARMVLDPEVGFGDSYMEGRIEINGDLVRILEHAFHAIRSKPKRSWSNRLFSRWLRYVQGNTLKGSATNIHHHYDLNTDFYKLWLDSRLVYTCAYFPTPSATLEESQEAKLDHICKKLQLQPGEKVVDAGCGWGALALHMARNYGVTVQAFNISHEQIQYARLQAKKEGLADRVEFVEDDYRNISGQYDAFVSVGMLEHVGIGNYRILGERIDRCLKPAGRGLIHTIGCHRPLQFNRWMQTRIFPGAEPPALSEMTAILEPRDMSVLDLEN